jgi:hypothetical protein
MNGPAPRLLAALTAVMPPGRRGFGQAMEAELDYARSRRDRARLVLGAARVALLPRPGPGGYGPTAGRAALIAVAGWFPLAVGLYLANVVFPAQQENTLGVVTLDALVILTLMAAGGAARRAAGGTGQRVVAGLVAGLVLAVLAMATFAVIDNAFLSIVSNQPAWIDGFRASHLTSMRAYVNNSLEATAPGMAILLALGGAALGPLGATADRMIVVARERRSGILRPEEML